MIKWNGQRALAAEGMNRTEQTAYSAAFEVIMSDYQTLCSINEKLREVERTASSLRTSDLQRRNDYAELNGPTSGQSPWEVCVPLVRLDKSEVLLCKRGGEHGMEYAVIDHAPATSAYAKATGGLDTLEISPDPRLALHNYLRSECQTLELMAKDVAASVRVFMADRFPQQDMHRVVNTITRMCKNAARQGFSETATEQISQEQSQSRGVRA